MVGHQRPGIEAGISSGRWFSHTLVKIVTIRNILDNPALFDSRNNYIMQSSRRIQSGPMRHFIPPISKHWALIQHKLVKLVNNVVPLLFLQAYLSLFIFHWSFVFFPMDLAPCFFGRLLSSVLCHLEVAPCFYRCPLEVPLMPLAPGTLLPWMSFVIWLHFPQSKRSSNEVLLLPHAPCPLHHASLPSDLRPLISVFSPLLLAPCSLLL